MPNSVSNPRIWFACADANPGGNLLDRGLFGKGQENPCALTFRTGALREADRVSRSFRSFYFRQRLIAASLRS